MENVKLPLSVFMQIRGKGYPMLSGCNAVPEING
jgi:hypothetical protein